MHQNVTYDQNCTFGKCYDLGRFGYDTPLKLINKIIEHAADLYKDEKPDVIFITGDYIQHSIDVGEKQNKIGDVVTYEEKHVLLKETWQSVITTIQVHFPNTPIISTFGNNDAFVDYIPTPPDDPIWGGVLFKDSWKIWMEMPKANLQKKTSDQINEMKQTFELGGWYRYDFDTIDRLSVLSINSNYFSLLWKTESYQPDQADKLI